ncbi:hypothetical protein HYH03_015708 [Edaphochlamys debaryana]|uniref:C-type lectin domain-containing protein n=1 Tax=Edaphochlamys debaryana TaxID=47281 RepID=A0A835XK16_9CHLO|nr:hypothetical protein HYH03_015708 [Edaphochlamys debaryana]|eukprot:KAG2485538.1 hypothetical protein HYH03_015708 [Edaphochlamys debaryana]
MQYALNSGSKITSWSWCRRYCHNAIANNRGTMLTYMSPEERDFVVAVVQSYRSRTGLRTLEGDASYIWLGATDAGHEGVYQWIDGTPWTFASWAEMQPDDFDNLHKEDCLMQSLTPSSWSETRWIDTWCDQPPFGVGITDTMCVCKEPLALEVLQPWPPTPPPPEPMPPASPGWVAPCPANSYADVVNGSAACTPCPAPTTVTPAGIAGSTSPSDCYMPVMAYEHWAMPYFNTKPPPGSFLSLAKWIWKPHDSLDATGDMLAVMIGRFDVASDTNATLFAIADNWADVFLDGEYLGSVQDGFDTGEPTSRPVQRMPVHLSAGRHTLALRAANSWLTEPAGVMATLVSGSSVILATSERWGALEGMALDPADTDNTFITPTIDLGAWNSMPGLNASAAFPDPEARWIWTSPLANEDAPTDVLSVFSATWDNNSTEPIGGMLFVAVYDHVSIFVTSAIVPEGFVTSFSTLPDKSFTVPDNSFVVAIGLQPGRNTITLRCAQAPSCSALGPGGSCDNALPNPAGVLASLFVGGLEELPRFVLRTDASWVARVHK